MEQPGFLFHNGKIVRSGEALIQPDNRSFRYGDGCFETVKLVKGRIALAAYHFERLFTSLEQLRFVLPRYFTAAYLEEQIMATAEKNGHQALARIRLTVYRGSGGVYDPENHFPNHLVQSWRLDPAANAWHANGLSMDVYTEARKVCDRFSMIKSNNYLPYIMAALWAHERKLNDAVLLNPYDRLADATIANIFLVKDGTVLTPPLSEGAVNGVMRRHLLHCLRKEQMPVRETELSPEDLAAASEIFLTNAISGIKWVSSLGQQEYTHQLSPLLFDRFVRPLWV